MVLISGCLGERDDEELVENRKGNKLEKNKNKMVIYKRVH